MRTSRKLPNMGQETVVLKEKKRVSCGNYLNPSHLVRFWQINPAIEGCLGGWEELGIQPSCAATRGNQLGKVEIYGKSIGNLWEIYGKSMGNLSKIYGKSIGNLWEIYRKSMGNL